MDEVILSRSSKPIYRPCYIGSTEQITSSLGKIACHIVVTKCTSHILFHLILTKGSILDNLGDSSLFDGQEGAYLSSCDC